MPPIPTMFLDCVVYLYPSLDAAEERRNSGAAGFLMAEPDGQERVRTYVVTCWHCAQTATAIGYNHRDDDGVTRIERAGSVEIEAASWIRHEGRNIDLAVAPLTVPLGARSAYLKRSLIPSARSIYSNFRNDKRLIGVGDDVYMVGRYLALQGERSNNPVVRFGNVAGLVGEIPTKEGRREAWLVEYRSLGGFSGSPVFVYWLTDDRRWSHALLGVNFSHFDQSVGIFTVGAGFAGVVPSWRILEILDLPEAKAAPSFELSKVAG
jgi:hypothetical protein